MTTDRTVATRPVAAPTDRPAGAAEHRDGNAFAALLDAHAADETPRRPARRGEAEAPVGDKGQRPTSADTSQNPGPVGEPSHGVEEPSAVGRIEIVAAPPAVSAPGAADVRLLPAAVTPIVPAKPHDLVAVGTAAIVVPPAPAAPAAAAPVVATPASPALAPPVEVPVPAAASQIPTGAPVPASLDAAAPAIEAPVSPQPAPVAAAPVATMVPSAGPEADAPVAVAPQPAGEPVVAGRVAATADPAAEPQPTATAPAPQPLAAAPATTTPVPERAVPLHRAPAAVATLLHVAAERGITHAKLALRPAELGGIEIRLQATAAGIAAQVVADSPEAARLLAQAGDDLRRALEAREVTLISLEVSTSSEQRSREGARGEFTDRDGNPVRPASTGATGDPDAPTTQTVIELPGGLLVDVLA
jgi:hypothetical protein